MRLYGGIDPGRLGAVSIVDGEGKLVEHHVMPTLGNRTDPKKLWDLLEKVSTDRDVFFALEAAQAFPLQGRSSIFTYGVAAGYCEMALVSLGLPYELVTPKLWQHHMHGSIDKKKVPCPKIRSAIKVQRMMGLDRFMVGKQTRPHEGLVDAYLLGVWCQRHIGKSEARAG